MMHIRSGKTRHAKRSLPLTAVTERALRERYEGQGRPGQGWVFPAPTKSGHIEESSIRKQHLAAISKAGLEHFELYCFRHTFLTILGASGCDPCTLCRIAGHGDIKMGMRYCHTQNEYVINAFNKMFDFRQKGVPAGGSSKNEENAEENLSSINPSKIPS
jgi:integrase